MAERESLGRDREHAGALRGVERLAGDAQHVEGVEHGLQSLVAVGGGDQDRAPRLAGESGSPAQERVHQRRAEGQRLVDRVDTRELGGREGERELEECERCSGVWLALDVFRQLCAEEERRTVFLGAELDARRTPATSVATVRYVPCPDCSTLMNRVNFGKRSGVVLDACAQHGTWFDAEELRRVVEFVRDGGLERARVRERMQLEEERRLLAVRQKIASWGAPQPSHPKDVSPEATGSFAQLLLRLFGTF